jgi:hypothetical protein
MIYLIILILNKKKKNFKKRELIFLEENFFCFELN